MLHCMVLQGSNFQCIARCNASLRAAAPPPPQATRLHLQASRQPGPVLTFFFTFCLDCVTCLNVLRRRAIPDLIPRGEPGWKHY